ncbi:MAG: hypothetical protein ACLUA4_09730 [Bifidobacterium sp.]
MVRYYKEADGHDGIKTAFTQAYALVNNIGDFTAEQQEQMNRDLQLICTPASEMSSDSFADANTLVLNRIMYEEDETGCKTWWVVVSLHASDSGSESDQEILSAKAKEYELLLGGPHRQEEGHQDHVAARAEALARMVGFDDDMVENLRIAGEYHDEGKNRCTLPDFALSGTKAAGGSESFVPKVDLALVRGNSSSGTNVSCEGGVMSSDPWLNLCWHVKPKRNFVNCRNIADS